MSSARRFLERGLISLLVVSAFGCHALAQEKPIIEIIPQIGHLSGVSSVAFSADGTRVLTGSLDKTAKLWDTGSGKLLRTFTGHSGFVKSVALSPDGARVLTGNVGQDPRSRTAQLWDAGSGKLLRTFEDSGGPVAFSPDGARVLTGSGDSTAKLWDAGTGELLRTFRGWFWFFWNSGYVTSVAFSPDGTQVLTGSSDGTVKLWEASTGELVRTFTGGFFSSRHSDLVTSVAVSPDGAWVLTGSWDKTAKLWNAGTGELIRTFTGHSEWVGSVAFSPDGARVLTGSYDMTAKLWDANTGELLKTFKDPDLVQGVGIEVAFAPDGARVLTDSGNVTWSVAHALRKGLDPTKKVKLLKLWDFSTGKLLTIFTGPSSTISSVAFSPVGARVLTGNWDHTAKLWDAGTGELLTTFTGHSGLVTSVAFSPDGARVLTGSFDDTAKLWDAGTGKLIRTFEGQLSRRGYEHAITMVAFSPDDARVLTSDGKTAKLWDAGTGEIIRTFEGHSRWGRVRSVAFSPDDARVLTSDGKTAKLWDAGTGELVRTFTGISDLSDVWLVAFSPDGVRVVTRSRDGTVKLWDAGTGELVGNFTGPSGWGYSVTFSPDGARVLVGSYDGTAKLRDARTGKLLSILKDFDASSVASFSPDGTHVLTAGGDGTAKLWDAGTGKALVTMIGGSDDEWVTMTPAGFFAGSSGGDKLLAVVRGFEVFSVEQFRDQLQRKDLVKEVLSGDRLKIYAKEATRLDLSAILASGDPPEIQLVKRELVGDSVRLTVRLFNNTGGGIGKQLKWRVNGVLQGGTEPEKLKNLDDPYGSVSVPQSLTLDPKRDNVITVTAYNGQDLLATTPFRIEVSGGDIFAPDERLPRLHIVGIGVNTYTGPRLKSLQLAVTDVVTLAAALAATAKAGGYDVPEPILLSENKATKNDIKRAFEGLAALDVQQQDALIVLLAGHGLSDGKCYYFVPFGARFDKDSKLGTEGVTCKDWEGWIGSVQVGKKALFIDTCESADATTIFRSGDNTRRESTMERLGRSSGYSIFTAARNAAQEDGELGHGLLTYAVLQALAKPGPRGDVDADSIKIHVEDEVPRLSKQWYRERQEPVVKVVGKFPLGPPQQSAAPVPRNTMVALPGQYVTRGDRPIIYRSKAGPDGEERGSIKPFKKVRVYKFSPEGWALIGREGKRMGWVPQELVREVD